MERVTFCAACGEPSSVRSARCESCDAPLRKQRFATLRMPQITPLSILIVLAGIAVLIAIVTRIVVG